MNDTPPSAAAAPLIVNVVASSYSGATWLNLVLGSHPSAFSVGEIDRMLKLRVPFCTIHGKERPFWKQFDLNSAEDAYLQIARLSGKTMLVVNNTQLLLDAQRRPGSRSKFILLIRDGRAVAASAMRKYPDVGVWRASRNWLRAMRKKERLVRQQPPADVLRVHHEALTADPEPGLRQVCAFLGIDFHPAMIEYWKTEHHFLGGNIGTMTPIAKEINAPMVRPGLDLTGDRARADPKSNGDFYQKADAAHFIDERWKKELSDRQLRLFALAAGRLNRRYGYSRALDRS